MHYIWLLLAIVTEVVGTAALQASQQFTRLGPSLIVVTGYGASYYFMALTLKTMPIGIVYAIWSGLGIAMIAAIGQVVFGQKLDTPAVVGILFILVGIVIIQLFSSTASH